MDLYITEDSWDLIWEVDSCTVIQGDMGRFKKTVKNRVKLFLYASHNLSKFYFKHVFVESQQLPATLNQQFAPWSAYKGTRIAVNDI